MVPFSTIAQFYDECMGAYTRKDIRVADLSVTKSGQVEFRSVLLGRFSQMFAGGADIRDVAFNSDASRIAILCGTRLWLRVATIKFPIFLTRISKGAGVVRMSPDGKYVAVVSGIISKSGLIFERSIADIHIISCSTN